MTLALPQVQYAVFKVHMTLPIFIFPYMGKDVKFSAVRWKSFTVRAER